MAMEYKGESRSKAMCLYLVVALSVTIAVFVTLVSDWQQISKGIFITGPAPEYREGVKVGDYWVVDRPTPNVTEGRNKVSAVVLHHTALNTIDQSLSVLTTPGGGVSCHVLIDKDGTRYVLADPEKITWHAGRSRLNGKDGVNNFGIGIEFQGNTLEEPLTDDQINSAIDYLLPIIEKYDISLADIVTHEQIRANYMKSHPKAKAHAKVDVTPQEHVRFMKALRSRLQSS